MRREERTSKEAEHPPIRTESKAESKARRQRG